MKACWTLVSVFGSSSSFPSRLDFRDNGCFFDIPASVSCWWIALFLSLFSFRDPCFVFPQFLIAWEFSFCTTIEFASVPFGLLNMTDLFWSSRNEAFVNIEYDLTKGTVVGSALFFGRSFKEPPRLFKAPPRRSPPSAGPSFQNPNEFDLSLGDKNKLDWELVLEGGKLIYKDKSPRASCSLWERINDLWSDEDFLGRRMDWIASGSPSHSFFRSRVLTDDPTGNCCKSSFWSGLCFCESISKKKKKKKKKNLVDELE